MSKEKKYKIGNIIIRDNNGSFEIMCEDGWFKLVNGGNYFGIAPNKRLGRYHIYITKTNKLKALCTYVIHQAFNPEDSKTKNISVKPIEFY